MGPEAALSKSAGVRGGGEKGEGGCLTAEKSQLHFVYSRHFV